MDFKYQRLLISFKIPSGIRWRMDRNQFHSGGSVRQPTDETIDCGDYSLPIRQLADACPHINFISI